MTETQTPSPECAKCADTGFIPPFMDTCDCRTGFLAAVDATAEKFAAERPKMDADLAAAIEEVVPEYVTAERRIGEISSHTLDGKVAVWTGTVWEPIETEALTSAEYAAKYGPMVDALATATEAVDADEAEFVPYKDCPVCGGLGWYEHGDDGDEIECANCRATGIHPDHLAPKAEPFVPKTSKDTFADLVAACESIGVTAGSVPDDKPDYASGYGEAGIYSDPSISYGSSKPKPKFVGKPMTAAQEALLAKLIAERDPAQPTVAHVIAIVAAGVVTAAKASSYIDALMKIAVDPAKKAPRTNGYDGVCTTCGGPVPAHTGRIERVDGRWRTYHLAGECLSFEAKAALEADRVVEPGLFKHEIDGVPAVFRVRKSRGSGRLYAERVIVHDHDGDKSVEFAYNGKAMGWLRQSSKLTWLEARDFGAAYGACVACGRTLSDPRSLVQQYGSTCAGHFGWPTVTKKEAEAIIAGVTTWEEATGIAV